MEILRGSGYLEGRAPLPVKLKDEDGLESFFLCLELLPDVSLTSSRLQRVERTFGRS
jgi:hypothetical protein